jgi:DNA helicase-4
VIFIKPQKNSQILLQQIVKYGHFCDTLILLQQKILDNDFLRYSFFKDWLDKTNTVSPLSFSHKIGMLLQFWSWSKNFPLWKANRITRSINQLKSTETFRKYINQETENNLLKAHGVFFDSVEKSPLTPKQREACICEEDNTLVVAGPGTGKTSTIVAKIGFLLQQNRCTPNEILALAFTKKSANELEERLTERLSVPIDVMTFHKLGLSILAQSYNGKPRLAKHAEDPLEKTRLISRLLKKLLDDSRIFAVEVIQFLSLYPTEVKNTWDFKDLSDYMSWLRSNDLRSLDGEKKNSYQECVIANWLILNGIEFKYEHPFSPSTKDRLHRDYCPDFYLPDYNIYIEHFGIDENGQTASYIPNKPYHQSMQWKREQFKKTKQVLIETYSWQYSKGVLFKHLKKELKEQNVSFKPVSIEIVLEKLNQHGRIDSFSELISSFLSIYKSANQQYATHERASKIHQQERSILFLRIFNAVFELYETFQQEQHIVDFEDMINQATKAILEEWEHPYKYVIIDEFQDISPARAALVKAILNSGTEASLFVVGDDCQSIYRFSGSDVGLMSQFENHFSVADQKILDTTFRFDNNASYVSSHFVLKNPIQIGKQLNAIKTTQEPSLILYFPPFKESRLNWALNEINAKSETPKTVLILERYKFHLPEEKEWGKLKSLFPNLSLIKMSIHAAKGLEADYVIMGLRGGVWGFPSQVMDDPLYDLVLSQGDEYANGEERRLFYVALTRSRNQTYLICESGYNKSIFTEELLSDENLKNHIEIEGVFQEDIKCKSCLSGDMILKDGLNSKFYGCSNYPLCVHTEAVCPQCDVGFLQHTQNKRGQCHLCDYQAEICPKCKTGISQVKQGKHGFFMGCSNYRDPEIKCSYTNNNVKLKNNHSKENNTHAKRPATT